MTLSYQWRQKFSDLCEGIFRELGHPPPEMTHDVTMPLGITVEIDGVLFEVVHASDVGPEHLLIECQFGPIPTERRIQILAALLQMNQILMQSGTGAFSANADTITYTNQQSLESVEAASILKEMAQIAQQVKHWRTGYFLDDAIPFSEYTNPHLTALSVEERKQYRMQFLELVGELCSEFNLVPHPPPEEEQQTLSLKMDLGKAVFSLSHTDTVDAAPLCVLICHGEQLPVDCNPDVLLSLLQLNHDLAYAGDSVFGLQVGNGEVIYICTSNLDEESGQMLVLKMNRMLEEVGSFSQDEEMVDSLPDSPQVAMRPTTLA
jgi:hypothetical protein